MMLKFLGLTKLQWGALVGVLFAVSYSLLIWNLVQTREQANLGAQTHAAVCQYKQHEAAQLAQTESVLGMTHKQLVARYGARYAALVESVPRSTLLTQIAHERAAVQALSPLSCSGR